MKKLFGAAVVMASVLGAIGHAQAQSSAHLIDQPPQRAESLLPLVRVLALAHESDPWQQASRMRQDSMLEQSVAAGSWMDPRMTLSAANLPTDSFDFNQEAMTQLKIGVTQLLPRGDTSALKEQQQLAMSEREVYKRENRTAEVSVTVTQLWLDTWLAQRSIDVIEADRSLFENLADVAQANYSSAMGKTRQQDLVRAQLELIRLEDRLESLRSRRDKARGQLNQWLPASHGFHFATNDFAIPNKLPHITIADPALLQQPDRNRLAQYFEYHPVLRNFDQAIEVEKSNVAIARQQYKPQWGLSASYGYRDDDPFGRERADFFSAGVSVDLPIFTGRRQDKTLKAAKYTASAIETEKVLIVRQFVSAFETHRQKLMRIEKRNALYQQQLLGQMNDQAEAALTAYTNDDGDFAEVVRARIAEINARIEALTIQVERLKIIAQLNYFMVKSQYSSGSGEQPL